MDTFLQEQWNNFCNNVEITARYLAGDDEQLFDEFMESAAEFYDSTTIGSYQQLLEAVARGTEMSVQWQSRSPVLAERDETASKKKMAYTESDNHAKMPMPTATMAEQAEQAKKSSQSSTDDLEKTEPEA